MRVKTFQAATMVEALAQVKREFGRQAVILNTRTVSRGVFGIRGKETVEITAARDASDLPPALRKDTVPARRGAELEDRAAPTSRMTAMSRVVAADTLLAEVGEIKHLVTGLVRESRRDRAPEVPTALLDTYQRLIENQVAEDLARALIRAVHDALGPNEGESSRDPNAVRRALARAVDSLIPAAGPIQIRTRGGPTVIALVGPTGVGKTTTIAKLAANLCLRDGRRVGLVTVDTYRIAAVEQLRTYAQIMDVPLAVVTTPRQLEAAVRDMAGRDVILVDTAGRSQRDAVKIEQLAAFFEVVRPDETHLVLAGTCGEAVLTEAVERFGVLGIDRVIFTKLDEAIGCGVLLSCLQKANAALSYLTTGQDVPDDIEVGHSEMLTDLALGERRGKMAEGRCGMVDVER